ncbi:MAG TPA: flagellar FlbD family protein [Clostridia bacterium]|nr:flagellar FlbD family protein [Clostridia bacterium]
MVLLTRLNHQPLAVNSDMIKFVEQSPDTVLTLITGEKLMVLESSAEVVQRIVAFRRSVYPVCSSLNWHEELPSGQGLRE